MLPWAWQTEKQPAHWSIIAACHYRTQWSCELLRVLAVVLGWPRLQVPSSDSCIWFISGYMNWLPAPRGVFEVSGAEAIRPT